MKIKFKKWILIAAIILPAAITTTACQSLRDELSSVPNSEPSQMQLQNAAFQQSTFINGGVPRR